MSHLVILDNEAAAALADARHPHHDDVVAIVQMIVIRKSRRAEGDVVVPTAARVEAAIDRSAREHALFGRFKVGDRPLDTEAANIAAALRRDLGTSISVADAHIGAVVATAPEDRITIVTSDPHDMRRVARSRRVEIVKL